MTELSDPPVYVIAQLRIHDRERYQRYVRGFAATLAPHAGTLLAADESPRVLDGAWDRDKVVLLRFDSEASYEAWANSPAYQAIAVDRIASTELVSLLVHGVPPRPARPR